MLLNASPEHLSQWGREPSLLGIQLMLALPLRTPLWEPLCAILHSPCRNDVRKTGDRWALCPTKHQVNNDRPPEAALWELQWPGPLVAGQRLRPEAEPTVGSRGNSMVFCSHVSHPCYVACSVSKEPQAPVSDRRREELACDALAHLEAASLCLTWARTTASQWFYIQKICPSEMRKKWRPFQINENWESSLPIDLPHSKC